MTRQEKLDMAVSLKSLQDILARFADRLDPERSFKIRNANRLDSAARTLMEVASELEIEAEQKAVQS